MNIFWVHYFYFIDKLPSNLKKELNNFNFFFSQNDQRKVEIGNIYDQSRSKYIPSCPMTDHYFDPWVSKNPVRNIKSKIYRFTPDWIFMKVNQPLTTNPPQPTFYACSQRYFRNNIAFKRYDFSGRQCNNIQMIAIKNKW